MRGRTITPPWLTFGTVGRLASARTEGVRAAKRKNAAVGGGGGGGAGGAGAAAAAAPACAARFLARVCRAILFFCFGQRCSYLSVHKLLYYSLYCLLLYDNGGPGASSGRLNRA